VKIESAMTECSDRETLLAEARLSAPPADKMVRYHDLPGLAREKRQFQEFISVDLAHVVMLTEEGIIERSVGSAILKQLTALRDTRAEDFSVDVNKGSFLLQVESHLHATIGEDCAGRMHIGRSRIDQGATVRRLYERNRLLDVLDRLVALRGSIAAKAAEHTRTIMPGYTHMQQAQPWVFGHYLLSFSTRLRDSFDRLTEAYSRLNRNPLGAVGLAGTSWPLNRQRTTELLAFDAVLENSKLGREAWYAAEVAGALSFVMADLNDLATDLHIWSSTEFGLVECHDSYCGTSSIFPQKKNPTGLETIKKAAGESVTWLATALATFRAEGTGDQAVRELPLLHEALEATGGMLDLLAGIIETLIVHESRMSAALAGSWCTASNLADVIVRTSGMSFRHVHHIVARLVRNSINDGLDPSQLTNKHLEKAAMETTGQTVLLGESELRAALDPHRFVQTRITMGGVGPSEVDRLLAEELLENQESEEWLRRARVSVDKARSNLDDSIRTILMSSPHCSQIPRAIEEVSRWIL